MIPALKQDVIVAVTFAIAHAAVAMNAQEAIAATENQPYIVLIMADNKDMRFPSKDGFWVSLSSGLELRGRCWLQRSILADHLRISRTKAVMSAVVRVQNTVNS